MRLATSNYHQHRYGRALRAVLTPATRWLDLGAGTRVHGGWQEPTADTLTGIVRPIGCDPMTAHLRENAGLAAAVGAVGDALPFKDGSLDLVSANMVLEHLADPATVFAEVARVLRPGGRFVFVTPHKRHLIVRLFALLFTPRVRQWLARLEGRDPRHIFLTHYKANTTEDLARLARDAGLVPEVEAFTSWPAGRGLESLAFRVASIGPGSNLLGVLVKRREPVALEPWTPRPGTFYD